MCEPVNREEGLYLKVPGSTSNLGPGFDSVGLAINRYLHVKLEPSSEWSFHYVDFDDVFPAGKDNMIYQTIEQIEKKYGDGKKPSPHTVTMTSELPLERGLGSSAAAIVAAVEIADFTMGLHLTIEEKVQIATTFEGHADNVAASLYGGLVIATGEEGIGTISHQVTDLEMIALIPHRKLKTTDSRSVLPDMLPFQEAVEASNIANVFVGAALQNDWKLAGKLMERDLFHQPYRKHLVPDLEKVRAIAMENGAYGAALSGAGPTLIVFHPKASSNDLQLALEKAFPEYCCELLIPASTGIEITYGAYQNQSI
ncbi:homoserine kinase [Alkalihalobacillus hwajinpoensis]|uniref:homoserine kinase n=1 Tax=Guptibacillus hwajinpoensis TaxID=208199 RepID=UPI0018841650|nr:homoserine kinase [Pseudalkalibacillus hwajinpoensis]MBF0708361.1 homoserine kinase [Pseudalkalibacillus hwajinpoensis]